MLTSFSLMSCSVTLPGVVCPQCGMAPTAAQQRMVIDACGHSKCRRCLLVEESGCSQCLLAATAGQVIEIIKTRTQYSRPNRPNRFYCIAYQGGARLSDRQSVSAQNQ